MCRWPLRAPTPLQSILWPIIDPILVTFGQIFNFRDPSFVTFYFYELIIFFRLNEEHFTFHLQYKHSGAFANCKYEELSYSKKIRKCATHSGNITSRENETYPAAHPHQPLIRKYPSPPSGLRILLASLPTHKMLLQSYDEDISLGGIFQAEHEKPKKLAERIQNSIHVHPCHTWQQTKGNNFNA